MELQANRPTKFSEQKNKQLQEYSNYHNILSWLTTHSKGANSSCPLIQLWPPFLSQGFIVQWHACKFPKKAKKAWNAVLYAVMWNFRLERNQCMFQDKWATNSQLWDSFTRTICFWLSQYKDYRNVVSDTFASGFFPLSLLERRSYTVSLFTF